MLKEVLTISAHAPRILFLTKKQRTSVLCVILTLLLDGAMPSAFATVAAFRNNGSSS